MEDNEPKIHKHNTNLSHGSELKLTFSGEQYKGQDVLDTRVEIESGTICWITWKDRDKFIDELNELIAKYAI
jgi:hypothetical protein